MTWTLMTWPMRPGASAPASMAAFTAATSPRTKAVTMPLPALSQPIISMFAAFSIASVPSIRATNPLHSSNPKASIGMARSFLDQLPVVKLPVASEGRRRLYWQLATRNWQLLHQFHIRRRLQVAGVALIGVDVHFEDDLRVVAHAEVVESHSARSRDLELHRVAVLHAVVIHVGGGHVDVAGGADDALGQIQCAFGPEDGAAGGAFDVAADPQREVEAQVD